MEDPKSIEDIRAAQIGLFNQMSNTYMTMFDKIFTPFAFESIKPLMVDLVGNVKAFIEVQTAELMKFQDIVTDQKYETNDKAVFEFDYVERTFATPEDPNPKAVNNFLTRQRLLNMLTEEEIAIMKGIEKNIVYSMSDFEPDALYNISILKQNPEFKLLYTFTEKWIRGYDDSMTQMEVIENKFGDIRSVDFYKDYTAIGCYSGDIYVTKGTSLDIVYKYNISL